MQSKKIFKNKIFLHFNLRFKVTPKEMFISPKSSVSLTINIQLDKYKFIKEIDKFIEGEFFCKILGFLRISPSDMFVQLANNIN